MIASQTEIIVTKDGGELLRRTVPPGAYIVGRTPECDLQVEADLVSRRHARLTIGDDRSLLLEDLGSSNGTFLDDQPVTGPTTVAPHQSIRIGVAQLTIQQPSGASAAASAAVAGLSEPGPVDAIGAASRYEIGAQIAKGGMGAILAARQPAIRREVAMKVMLGDWRDDDRRRFIAEAQVTGQLEHPNIVPVHELNIDERGQPYYTMKMVRGITLKKILELLAEGTEATVKKYSLAVLLTIYQKVCDAVAFAHSKHILHRDLKPENIMLGDFGEVLVMDWGLAKRIGDCRLAIADSDPAFARDSAQSPIANRQSAMTLAGTIMGTPQYMSPEQARGEITELDARSDIYALGAILYNILALRPPVTGQTAMEVVSKVAEGHVESLVGMARRAVHNAEGLTAPPSDTGRRGAASLPHLSGGAIPASLAAVVGKAMAFDRDQRYWTVEELQADLTAYQSGFATRAENAGWWKRAGLAVRRNKAAAIGAATVLVVGVSLGTQAILGGRRATQALLELKKTAPDLLALAQSESAAQHFESALKKLDSAITIDPGLESAYWQRVWALAGEEKWDDSARAATIAATKDRLEMKSADQLLSNFKALAAMPPEKRMGSSFAQAVVDDLIRQGATGPAATLVINLKLGRETMLQLTRNRVEQWLGKGARLPDGGEIAAYDGNRLRIVLSGLPVTSVDALAGLPIDDLRIDSTKMTNLKSVGRLPLKVLSIRGCLTGDLAPLRSLTSLRDLQLSGDQIQDLRPLSGLPLQSLNVVAENLVDLEPLRKIKTLAELNISRTKVADLRPLEALPLRRLGLNINPVAELAPLQGMPLRELSIQNTKVTNLDPVRKLPLEMLDVHQMSPALDLAPLLDVTGLQKLVVDEDNASLGKLRNHPGLRIIAPYQRIGGNPYSVPEIAVGEFWKVYDAKHNAEVK